MFLIDTNAINRQGKTFFTGAVATGGTITTDGDYKVHTFNSSGNFQVTSLGDGPVLEYLEMGEEAVGPEDIEILMLLKHLVVVQVVKHL